MPIPAAEPAAETAALSPAATERAYRARPADYAVILKPRVMSLVVFVGLAGLLLAPEAIEPWRAAVAVLCIAVGAGAAGAINMWYDRDIDVAMRRTQNRPIPAGRMHPARALAIGAGLSVASVATMTLAVNPLAAALLAATILYYVFVYTVWLKRRTAENIVIGGVSGALPPVIGWAAATGSLDVGALLLFAIIFLWTPPHSWALALFSNADYQRAGVPMLPVVAGVATTRLRIAVYTVLMLAATAGPAAIGLAGWLYAAAAGALGVGFAWHVAKLWRETGDRPARALFGYSIAYLFLIFVALLADRALIHGG